MDDIYMIFKGKEFRQDGMYLARKMLYIWHLEAFVKFELGSRIWKTTLY